MTGHRVKQSNPKDSERWYIVKREKDTERESDRKRHSDSDRKRQIERDKDKKNGTPLREPI